MSSASTPPSSIAVLFARGVIARLALWPALKLAVHHSWGGPESAQKQRWLAGVIVDQFEEFFPSASSLSTSTSALASGSSGATALPPDAAYLEEMLLQIMSDEFEVSLEDDSALAVANDIVKLWEDVCDRSDRLVVEMETQAEKVKSRVPQHEVGAGSGSDWEDEGDSESDEGEDAEGGEGEEIVPLLIDRSRDRQRAEPEVDEDGFTIVKKKGRR